ncbi:DUF1848 domain-containing protein [Halodesulfovibrio marinisediminis]|uniref:DUF1848 domain-containing protein n=1 Tax=Halodesulfovibrio marinisediminis DSM 17456 TaxID=1121457 RepID=A0A1N6J9E7_9BACT|nr:DUF1848 domain-containing protein [Halodesulfovibrio marinisediminis]SIO40994.1 protein of unknown function [Halodesulfovibrio marinisediminis DSM 17456]
MPKKEILQTNEGEKNAQAPAIISVSRSTDIPAYHSDWFMNRLRTGYLAWINPFNRKKSYISFSRTGAIVFWTKNPAPMLKYLDELDSRNLAYYFQYTLNDYDAEKLEPNVPNLERRLATFKELSTRIGADRIVWRFDPIILGNGLTVSLIIKRFEKLAKQLQGHTKKVVISFVDIADYRKVQNTLKCSELSDLRAPSIDEEVTFAIELSKIAKKYGLAIATCCEKRDLTKYGVSKNKCIDDELLFKLCTPKNEKLTDFLRQYQTQHSLLPMPNLKMVPKDKGQREECGCVISKDIGMYDTCGHLCVYCYANTSDRVVTKNLKLKDNNAETIIPI